MGPFLYKINKRGWYFSPPVLLPFWGFTTTTTTTTGAICTVQIDVQMFGLTGATSVIDPQCWGVLQLRPMQWCNPLNVLLNGKTSNQIERSLISQSFRNDLSMCTTCLLAWGFFRILIDQLQTICNYFFDDLINLGTLFRSKMTKMREIHARISHFLWLPSTLLNLQCLLSCMYTSNAKHI